MKKVLSVILAIVMIATCMPAVSAAGNYDVVEGFIEEFVTYYAKQADIYNIGKDYGIIHKEIIDCFGEELGEKWWFNEIDNMVNMKEFIETHRERLPEITVELEELNERIEEHISQKYTRVIDTAHYYLAYGRCAAIIVNDGENFETYLSETYGEDAFLRACNVELEKNAYIRTIDFVNPPSDVQEKFDEIVAPWIEFFNGVADCEKGCHPYGDYTDLGNGTHKSECTFCKKGEIIESHTWGEYVPDDNEKTETAKCEKCDATDVIEVEWEELPAEDNSNFFTALIATFRDIFAKIAEFFKNLFN